MHIRPHLSKAVKSLQRALRRRNRQEPNAEACAETAITAGDDVAMAPPHLISVTSAGHGYTLRLVAEALAARGLRHELWTYPQLFAAPSLPRATYIFTDFDRLHPWQIELAARFHARLRAEGQIVLNDPRRFLPRTALLRRLHRAGINRFGCWLPAEGEHPQRFPVFLRTIHAHRGVESDLLHDPAEAEAALTEALTRGRVISDLAFIEFAAEPSDETEHFRKHACYGIGGTMIRALSVTDTGWVAKHGVLGAASDADYAADLAEQRAYPHDGLMREVFALAGVEFGRIDYGMVAGRPQIYEINTNPAIAWTGSHSSADRLEVDRLIHEAVIEALCRLVDAQGSGANINASDLVPKEPPGAIFGQP